MRPLYTSTEDGAARVAPDIVTQLTAAGIDVQVDPETYPNGRFARTHDPEGNAVELWEPIGGVIL